MARVHITEHSSRICSCVEKIRLQTGFAIPVWDAQNGELHIALSPLIISHLRGLYISTKRSLIASCNNMYLL